MGLTPVGRHPRTVRQVTAGTTVHLQSHTVLLLWDNSQAPLLTILQGPFDGAPSFAYWGGRYVTMFVSRPLRPPTPSVDHG